MLLYLFCIADKNRVTSRGAAYGVSTKNSIRFPGCKCTRREFDLGLCPSFLFSTVVSGCHLSETSNKGGRERFCFKEAQISKITQIR